MTELTPDQNYSFYKALLEEVIKKHNPAGLSNIDFLLKQFPGKEHMVYKQICQKCGVKPREPPTIDDFVDGIPKLLVKPVANADGRLTEWLHKNSFQKYADLFLTMSWDEFIQIGSVGPLIELGVIPKHAQSLLNAIGAIGQNRRPEHKADFEVAEDCFTKIMTRGKEEKWVKARVTCVNGDNTFDIFVHDSSAFGVQPEAVSVPRNMLKKLTEDVEVAETKNTKQPQFQPGDRIRVFGLRSHTTYNNLCGQILLYVPNEKRYQVKLDTKDVIAIKERNVAAENCEMQHAAAIQSGRSAFKRLGGSKEDETGLQHLMLKLLKENPNMDPKKLGEFVAGYVVAKKKINKGE